MMDNTLWRAELDRELHENILPFWIRHAQDTIHGGFIGGMTNSNDILDFPRSAVLTARILWTFAAAAQQRDLPEYREIADRAYETILERFWDPKNGGLYGAVNAKGEPVHRRKLTYAQAFGIYGLSEYYGLTKNLAALRQAEQLFAFVETHVADHEFGGYLEGCAEDGSPDPFAQITDAEPEHRKSMNTLLHLLEAYTNLRRYSKIDRLADRHQQLLEIMGSRVINPDTGHFHMYFRADWTPLGHRISYGHDIEGAWLLREAAHLTDHPNQADQAALGLARGVLHRGFMAPGRLGYEGDLAGIHDRTLHWWAHAEAMVGFSDAFELTGDQAFRTAAEACWQTIEAIFVDRNGGDWFKVLKEDGTPFFRSLKIGPWECPYHHARACLEMIRRLA
jgi:cellobiose epimerase